MKFTVIAALAMALAPVAQAQVGCDLVNRLVTSSATGFEDIRGDEIDDGWYDAKIYMGGAEECSVDIGQDYLFDCLWEEESQASARTWVTALDLAVGKCLPGWTRSAMSGASFNNLPINIGASYRKDAVSIEMHSETVDSETLVWFRVFSPAPVTPAVPKPATAAASLTSAAPAAPWKPVVANPSAPRSTGNADIRSSTPSSVNRAPRLTDLDLRYFNDGAGYWEFIDASQISRVGSRAYVWVLNVRDPPLTASAYFTLREVACGTNPQMRYIHSLHLGADYRPNGTSVVNTSSKFEPGANDDVQDIIDVACHGATLTGASYKSPADAAANKARAAQGG